MSERLQAGLVANGYLHLLAYAQHMAETARTEPARCMFEAYAEQERRRLEANGVGRLRRMPRAEAAGPKAVCSALRGWIADIATARLRGTRSKSESIETGSKEEGAGGEAMKKSTGSKGKKVAFKVAVEPGSEVFVAGSFNNWDPTQYRMSDNPGSGQCKTTLLLATGRHEYKFVVNGEWRTDPNCAESAPNELGSLNSVIVV